MKDFNFFSPFLKEKRNKRLKRIYIITLVSLITSGLLSFIALNLYQINLYKSEISNVESYLNSERTKALLKKYEETSRVKALTDEYYNKVVIVDKTIASLNTVNTEILSKLTSIMPQNSTMTNLQIQGSNIQASFKLQSLVEAAEIQHNLKGLNIFEMVHVSVINTEIGYSAIVNCNLKDVKHGEATANQ